MSTAAPLQNTAAKSPSVSKASHAGLLLQRKCACGGSASSSLTGECEECNKTRLQKKLSIGASNDPLELEADRVADQVLAAPAHPKVSRTLPRIQRFTGHSSGQADTVPASVDRVLAGSGRPLDPALQQDMGKRFGHDFSQVRVHSGADAEQSALDVNAHAYTVGHNIVFGAGRFAPESHEGRRLLAHELTHVVQQQAGPASTGAAPTIQRKGADCPKGFSRYPHATWFHCDEPGAKELKCATCTGEGKRDCNCHSIASKIGTNLIAPKGVGKCGDVFEVALPGGTSTHEAIKAEAPGGVDLDIHQDFIVNTLSLPVTQGRYDVCLKKTGRNDPRVIKCGSAKCSSPESPSEVVESATESAANEVSKTVWMW